MRVCDIKTSLSSITHDIYVKSISTVQNVMGFGGDEFMVEKFCEQGMAHKVDAALTAAGYEMSTRQNMLTAVSKFVGIVTNSKNTVEYRDIINKYDIALKEQTAKRKDTCEHDIKEIHMRLEKIAYAKKGVMTGVRVLASLLRYGNYTMINKIKLSTLPQTFMVDDRTNHYLDVQNKIWYLRKTGVEFKQIEVPDEFFIPITDILETYDCLGTVSGACYADAQAGGQSISNAFSKLMGMTYTTVKAACEKHLGTVPKQEESIEPVPEQKLKPKIVVKKKDNVAEGETVPKKITIPVKKKEQLSYEWAYFDRVESDKIHIRLVKNVMGAIFCKTDKFYVEMIDTPEGLTAFKEEIQKLSSIHTRCNVCNAMCKLLEHVAAKQYINFTIFRDECALDRKRIVKPSVEFSVVLQNLKCACNDTKICKAVRVMCLLILESYGDGKNGETGVLRPSDLLNTKFTDDGEHSYIDINTRILHIKEKYTKNSNGRDLQLSEGFIAGLYKIYGNILPSTVLCQDNLDPYKDTSNICRNFKRAVGYKFDDVRASYLAYRRQNVECPEELRELCRREGHSVSTALEYYDDRSQLKM